MHLQKAEDIDTAKQVSIRATEMILPLVVAPTATENDITTGGDANSHRNDIATRSHAY